MTAQLGRIRCILCQACCPFLMRSHVTEYYNFILLLCVEPWEITRTLLIKCAGIQHSDIQADLKHVLN